MVRGENFPHSAVLVETSRVRKICYLSILDILLPRYF